MRIPPGTPSGKVMRVRGQGVHGDDGKANGKRRRSARHDRGASCPTSSTTSQREAVEALARGVRRRPARGAVREAARTEGAPMADTRALYVISVAAELAGVHPQTLRIYERKGLLAPAAHQRPQPALLRPRHPAAAPHPGAHQRRHLAARRAAILALEQELAARAATASPSSKRASTRCSRRWKSASRPRTSSTGARSSRCARGVVLAAISRHEEVSSHGTRPQQVHPQDPRGDRRRAGRRPRRRATPRSRPSTCCARCSTSPRASSTACSSASAST